MKHAFLFCLFILLQQFCYGQYLVQHDLKSKKLYGKVKTVKTFYNNSTAYSIDTFDKDGRLLQNRYVDFNEGGNSICSYILDKSSHLLMTVSSYQSSSDTTIYKYNAEWKVVERTSRQISKDNTLFDELIGSSKTKFIYDAKGNCVTEKSTVFNSSEGRTWTQNLSFKYNAKNQLTEITTDHLLPEEDVSGSPIFYKFYEYFEMGTEGRFVGKAILKYDTANRLIGQDLYGYNGKIKGKAVCIYDEHGNIVSLTASGYRIKPFSWTNKYKFQYDKYNNWIIKQVDDNSYKRTIEYY